MEMYFKDWQRKKEESCYSVIEIATGPDFKKEWEPHDCEVHREQDGLQHLEGWLGPMSEFVGSLL